MLLDANNESFFMRAGFMLALLFACTHVIMR